MLYLGVAAIGAAAGRQIKKSGRSVAWSRQLQSVLVLVMLFLLGMRLGADREVISEIAGYGVTAVVLLLFALAGSILAIFLVRKFVGIDRNGNRRGRES
ncbi:MAG: LysO family transporter [Lachnospiraceae bacterium]|nr:LysO family transporter [Lachnospiraceae bacterium]